MSHFLAGRTTSSGRRVRGAVRDATRAASVHNSQPWQFVVADSQVEVVLDPRLRPTVIDADGRWALASLGAAAANLELGLGSRLERAVQLEILPGRARLDVSQALNPSRRGRGPIAVARASWSGPRVPASDGEHELHAAVPARHTTRWPLYGEVEESAWVLVGAAVRSDADGAHVDSVRPDATQTAQLLELTAEVDRRWSRDVAYLAEIERWAHMRGGRGVPTRAFGPRDESGRLAARDFSAGVSRVHWRPADDYFEVRPQLLVITSASDDAPAWVRAGRGMQRAMLAAAARGLGVGVLGQLVEDAGTRRRAAEVLGLTGSCVQQVLRIGLPGDRSPTRTPRRPFRCVIAD